MITMIENIDYFYTAPNQHSEIECKACGTKCNVERGRSGSTLVSAVLKLGEDKHDRFVCRYIEEEWHIKATALKRDIINCNSPSLQKIMESDLEMMIRQTIT